MVRHALADRLEQTGVEVIRGDVRDPTPGDEAC